MKILLFDPSPTYQLLFNDLILWLEHTPICTDDSARFFAALADDRPDVLIVALDTAFEAATAILTELDHSKWPGVILVVADAEDSLDGFRSSPSMPHTSLSLIFELKPWTHEQFTAALAGPLCELKNIVTDQEPKNVTEQGEMP